MGMPLAGRRLIAELPMAHGAKNCIVAKGLSRLIEAIRVVGCRDRFIPFSGTVLRRGERIPVASVAGHQVNGPYSHCDGLTWISEVGLRASCQQPGKIVVGRCKIRLYANGILIGTGRLRELFLPSQGD